MPPTEPIQRNWTWALGELKAERSVKRRGDRCGSAWRVLHMYSTSKIRLQDLLAEDWQPYYLA